MTPDMSYEREGAWQSNAQNIRVDGTRWDRKKTQELINVLPALFGACVYRSVACGTSQYILVATSIPGTGRFKKCLF